MAVDAGCTVRNHDPRPHLCTRSHGDEPCALLIAPICNVNEVDFSPSPKTAFFGPPGPGVLQRRQPAAARSSGPISDKLAQAGLRPDCVPLNYGTNCRLMRFTTNPAGHYPSYSNGGRARIKAALFGHFQTGRQRSATRKARSSFSYRGDAVSARNTHAAIYARATFDDCRF